MDAMFAPVMSSNIKSATNPLSGSAKARIVRDLQRGDQSRIAEALGTDPAYVKQVLRYRRNAKSRLSQRIWSAANRLLRDRRNLANGLDQ